MIEDDIFNSSIIFSREWVNISPKEYTNLRMNDQVRVTVESGSKCVFKSAVALNFRQFKQKPKDLKYIDVKIKVKNINHAPQLRMTYKSQIRKKLFMPCRKEVIDKGHIDGIQVSTLAGKL